MCGRYTLTLSKDAVWAQIPGIRSFDMPWKPHYNLAPTQVIPAMASDRPDTVTGLRWGLIPSWAKDHAIGQKLINARGETLTEKPSFKNLYRSRRCLIPADGFYEWQAVGRRKQPTYIRFCSGQLFTFAGLWDAWKDTQGNIVRSCTIITTLANELIQKLHHRMPVIVEENLREMWLDQKFTDTKRLDEIIRPFPSEAMEAYPVSPAVNKAENDGPELIKPIADQSVIPAQLG
jgi:putative SOS response-associated peptidase YedK